MSKDPEQLAHLEWLGYVQPVGLVVSVPALLAAQAHVNRNIAPDHQRFLGCLPRDKNEELIPEIRNLAEFTQTVLGWEKNDLTTLPAEGELPEEFASLEVVLPEYHETLRPTHVVRELSRKNGQSPWLMLVQCWPSGTKLDEPIAASDRNWHASPHAKFERLLRETEVPIGLLSNGTHLRLSYAPRGETSGFMTFSVAEMSQVAGRPIFAGLHMLLSSERLFSLTEKQRLPAILAESRKYQNIVSTQLAEQVLAALYELLRGFQAANDQRHGELLREVLAGEPNHVYAGLLNVLMRLVFVLYAEDRGLMSADPVYGNFYSVTGLFDRLRADAGRFPDTMDQRYGAWAQLLTLFRLIYEGGSHSSLRIPAREGYLFDPDRYPFLEGRIRDSRYSDDAKHDVPHVSDGVIFRVLSNLLILDGERLSYLTLDMEQIGSVYEAIMGFNLEVAEGRSIAIKPTKAHGAPATINLEELLATDPAQRAKWLADKSDQKITGQAADELKSAATIDDLLAALDRKIAKAVTPNIVPKEAMVLQPSDERRRSGSHYTPRSLTEPIVRTTLKPILERLGDKPKSDQILDLKVCDPAMGSGAFLVEACRQLGDQLVKAWHLHDCVPVIPPDEDEVLHARRLVAQRCLYGVDKNPMAVDLAKLSLWLATLAKDHPFTFLDHSLRHGDSLVGLTKKQIEAFHWNLPAKRSAGDVWFGDPIAEKMKTVTEHRKRIVAASEDMPYDQLGQQLNLAEEAQSLARLTGDLVISAYFSADKDRQRVERLNELARTLVDYFAAESKIAHQQILIEAVMHLRKCRNPVKPFHWEIEFPEVFDRENRGFHGIVGNPPFLGGTMISTNNSSQYLECIKAFFDGAGNRTDLVAYFFRRSFSLCQGGGVIGLVATKTIAQGDTRKGGLRWICKDAGNIHQDKGKLERTPYWLKVVGTLPLHHSQTPPCCQSHCPVGDTKRLQRLRIGQQSDTLFNPVCSHLRPIEQLFGSLPSSCRSGWDLDPLCLDPPAILRNKSLEFRSNLADVGKFAQGIHRQLDAFDRRRSDSLHFSLWNPACPHGPALILVNLRLRCHAVTHGEFKSVAVLQVGNALIPVSAIETLQVGPWNERDVPMNLQLSLKCECLVAPRVGLRYSAVNEEHRNGSGSRRQAAFAVFRQHRPNGNYDGQPGALGHWLFDWLFSFGWQIDDHNLFALSSFPDERLLLFRFASFIVAPSHRDFQVLGISVHEQAGADGRRQIADASCSGLRSDGIVCALRVTHYVQFLSALFVDSLFRVCFKRNKKTGQIPRRRPLWQDFIWRAQYTCLGTQDFPRAHEVEPQCINQSCSNFNGIHGSLLVVSW